MLFAAVHESAIGTKRTSLFAPHVSAFGGKADVALSPSSVKTLSRHWALVSEISVVRLS
jgi:hypothetical protein